MGNRTWCRLRDIVARLTVGDATLTALAEPYDVSVQAVAKHLEVLEAAGVASRRQEGRERPAHLEAEVLDLMTAWVERYRRRADERDRRLDQVLSLPPSLAVRHLQPAGHGRLHSAIAQRPMMAAPTPRELLHELDRARADTEDRQEI
ncbi:MAG: hypothetical protein R6U94_05855 [Nitriliruptoraceae bacterium]